MSCKNTIKTLHVSVTTIWPSSGVVFRSYCMTTSPLAEKWSCNNYERKNSTMCLKFGSHLRTILVPVFNDSLPYLPLSPTSRLNYVRLILLKSVTETSPVCVLFPPHPPPTPVVRYRYELQRNSLALLVFHMQAIHLFSFVQNLLLSSFI
jgi:hypothetical protein